MMIKYLKFGMISLLLMCLSMLSVCAQNPYAPIPLWQWDGEVEHGKSELVVEYVMTFYGTEGLDEVCKDTRIIEIGKGIRKDYSKVLEEAEQRNHKISKEGGSPSTKLSSDVYPIEVFCFDDGKTRINQRTLLTGPILQYSEECPKFKWTLVPESMTIEGYKASKAIMEYGGRNWTAWYTEEIPVDGGPYKFCGLPGLIVKMSSDDGSYTWTMTGIEKKSVPVFEKKFVYRKCTPAEARKLTEEMYKHPFIFLKNSGVKTLVRDKNGRLVKPGSGQDSISLFYDPIEK